MWEKRDYKDPKYVKWRKAIFRRDKYKCQFPGCNHADKRLQAHHIKLWASYPTLRYDKTNGICLCRTHHDLVTGREQEYEGMFMKIVAAKGCDRKTLSKIIMMKYHREEDDG